MQPLSELNLQMKDESPRLTGSTRPRFRSAGSGSPRLSVMPPPLVSSLFNMIIKKPVLTSSSEGDPPNAILYSVLSRMEDSIPILEDEIILTLFLIMNDEIASSKLLKTVKQCLYKVQTQKWQRAFGERFYLRLSSFLREKQIFVNVGARKLLHYATATSLSGSGSFSKVADVFATSLKEKFMGPKLMLSIKTIQKLADQASRWLSSNDGWLCRIKAGAARELVFKDWHAQQVQLAEEADEEHKVRGEDADFTFVYRSNQIEAVVVKPFRLRLRGCQSNESEVYLIAEIVQDYSRPAEGHFTRGKHLLLKLQGFSQNQSYLSAIEEEEAYNRLEDFIYEYTDRCVIYPVMKDEKGYMLVAELWKLGLLLNRGLARTIKEYVPKGDWEQSKIPTLHEFLLAAFSSPLNQYFSDWARRLMPDKNFTTILPDREGVWNELEPKQRKWSESFCQTIQSATTAKLKGQNIFNLLLQAARSSSASLDMKQVMSRPTAHFQEALHFLSRALRDNHPKETIEALLKKIRNACETILTESALEVLCENLKAFANLTTFKFNDDSRLVPQERANRLTMALLYTSFKDPFEGIESTILKTASDTQREVIMNFMESLSPRTDRTRSTDSASSSSPRTLRSSHTGRSAPTSPSQATTPQRKNSMAEQRAHVKVYETLKEDKKRSQDLA